MRSRPRRRRCWGAATAGAAWAAGTRWLTMYLQAVDEAGIDRVARIHGGVDLALGLPEVGRRLHVVEDLSMAAGGAHDLFSGVEVVERHGVQVSLDIIRRLTDRVTDDLEGVGLVLLHPGEGLVVRLHKVLDRIRVLLDEILAEGEAVHDQVGVLLG